MDRDNLGKFIKGHTVRKGKKATYESRLKMSIAQKGRKHRPWTEEEKKKMGLSRIGHIGYNKGKSRPISEKLKISNTMKGRMPKNIQLLISKNKGRKFTLESRIKMSCAQSKIPIEQFKGFRETTLSQKIRTLPKYYEWRLSIFKRDNFTCSICNENKVLLNAHHLDRLWEIIYRNKIKSILDAENCSELWNINNGITVCELCHRKIHFNKLKEQF